MTRQESMRLIRLAIAAVACAASAGCGAGGGASSRGAAAGGSMTGADLSLGALLSGAETVGFARAIEPLPFAFPRDHGPHPSFRSEWWYLTGILRSRGSSGEGARRFGYQFTIFRQALVADPASRDSAWATRDLYMGHLAVTDIDGRETSPGARFHATQRFSRDGLALAGARSTPFDVWIESWRVSGPRAGADAFPMEVDAREAFRAEAGARADPIGFASIGFASIGVALSISAGRGPILQGDRGLSLKGTAPGNASFYYSCTRLPTQGRVTIADRTFEVEGTSWLDREWSTSALDPDVVGWDWLGVHLDDGRDLMLYRLRERDGRATEASRATLIQADGTTHLFRPAAFSLTPRGQWQSADGRARYPAGFRLTIPEESLDVTITPLLPEQELRLAVRYWEGAVALAGLSAGRPIRGEGYLEMTGYAAGSRAPEH